MDDNSKTGDERSASSAMSEYIGVIAHRIHTPVTSIRWQLESLIDGTMGELTDDQKETLEGIHASIESLNEFSRAILYVYELEKDMPMIKSEEVSISDLIKRAEKSLDTLISEKKSRMMPEKSVEDISITTDPDIAFMIVRTFVENSLRYSPANSEFPILVKDNDEGAIITVEDRGIGIPIKRHMHIGKKFYRTPEAKKLWTDGVGLNLYIAMNLAERTGGKITFESDEGKGASFSWFVPKRKQRKQPWEGAVPTNT